MEGISACEQERGNSMPSMNHAVIQTNLLVGSVDLGAVFA
jgi:hypothetical protein